MSGHSDDEPIELQIEEDRAGVDSGDTVFDRLEESTWMGGIEDDRQAVIVRPDDDEIDDPDAERAAEHQRAATADRPNIRFNPGKLHSDPEADH